jgi:hypothetical protein
MNADFVLSCPTFIILHGAEKELIYVAIKALEMIMVEMVIVFRLRPFPPPDRMLFTFMKFAVRVSIPAFIVLIELLAYI